jgi:glycosyltransferase involved in cell wall biosynthesis
MKKLIIQIPCLNEAETLAVTLADLPREVPGIDVVEWLIIDDGSTDDTAKVARENGVDHVVSMGHNSGLARAFMAGVDECLRLGADVIVNTDADNQYCAADIPAIVAPIIAGEADMVIGTRPIMEIEHFSVSKKLLQRLGSTAVRVASGTDIADAPSGFRAIDRRAAMRLNVFSEYTYTVETIIQAGNRGMKVIGVPVHVNGDLRPSRLVKSVSSYVRRSLLTIFRIFMAYRPMTTFMVPGLIMLGLGLLVGVRFLWLFAVGQGMGHIQSLILAAILLLLGFMLAMFGLIAELLGVNRKLLEDIQWRLRRMEYGTGGSGWERPTSAAADEDSGPR